MMSISTSRNHQYKQCSSKNGCDRVSSKRGRKGVVVVASISGPGQIDVLCGRGRGFFDHPGNRRMLSIIAQFKLEYQTASKVEKSSITQIVLQHVLESEDGVRPRFLKQISSGKNSLWYELSESEVHKKVAHTLREQKSIVKVSKIAVQKRQCHSKSSLATSEEILSLEPLPLVASISSDFGRLQCHSKVEIPFLDYISKRRSFLTMLNPITTSSTIVPISDDETSEHNDQFQEETSDHECASNPVVLGRVSEPLGPNQEPVFSMTEIDDLLHTVLDDQNDMEDMVLDSFLEGLDLFNTRQAL